MKRKSNWALHVFWNGGGGNGLPRKREIKFYLCLFVSASMDDEWEEEKITLK